MNECAGPNCDLLIDGDEPFCSTKCEREYDAYAAEMDAWLEMDHWPRYSELEAAS